MGESLIFRVGQSASLERTVTAADVDAFAKATGDFNPIHLDDAYAAGTRFGRRIAHGMLAASYVSSLLGTQLPGRGCVYLSQTLKFTKPVFIGDTLTVSAVIVGYRPERGVVTLETSVSNQRGETVLRGEAVCLAGDAVATPTPAAAVAAAG
jgi:acyl dehydratase